MKLTSSYIDLISIVCRSVIAGAVLLSVHSGSVLRPALAQSESAAYVLTAGEIATLLGGQTVTSAANSGGDWDTSFQYSIPDSDLDLVISASVLATVADAQQFMTNTLEFLKSDNERTDARTVSASDYGADELVQLHLIYRDNANQRVGEYVRLVRIGRAVASVEAVGSPAADDRGAIDNDRALAMTRAFELMIGKMHYYPADAARALPGMEPFARAWGKHGLSLDVDPTGHGQATWRVYRWCSDDPTPPCDRITDNMIESGGYGAIVLYRVNGLTASGVVIGTSDPEVLRLGAVTLTVDDVGMAQLKQDSMEVTLLCGPDYARLAPQSIRDQSPCGA